MVGIPQLKLHVRMCRSHWCFAAILRFNYTSQEEVLLNMILFVILLVLNLEFHEACKTPNAEVFMFFFSGGGGGCAKFMLDFLVVQIVVDMSTYFTMVIWLGQETCQLS